MNSNNRMAATLYSLGTVCLRNISINTLHKGDDDDDDDNNNNNNSPWLSFILKLIMAVTIEPETFCIAGHYSRYCDDVSSNTNM